MRTKTGLGATVGTHKLGSAKYLCVATKRSLVVPCLLAGKFEDLPQLTVMRRMNQGFCPPLKYDSSFDYVTLS